MSIFPEQAAWSWRLLQKRGWWKIWDNALRVSAWTAFVKNGSRKKSDIKLSGSWKLRVVLRLEPRFGNGEFWGMDLMLRKVWSSVQSQLWKGTLYSRRTYSILVMSFGIQVPEVLELIESQECKGDLPLSAFSFQLSAFSYRIFEPWSLFSVLSSPISDLSSQIFNLWALSPDLWTSPTPRDCRSTFCPQKADVVQPS